MSPIHRQTTHRVRVGHVELGGGAPVVVQAMTSTATADVPATARQALELAAAGAELVRVTVDTEAAARAVAEIRAALDDSGCAVPLVGDFHYNGHLLLTRVPECARALAKVRVNPGNVGRGTRRDANFSTVCRVASDHGLAVRIGVNAGSLDPELVAAAMAANAAARSPLPAAAVLDRCLVRSALDGAEQALAAGLGPDRVVLSCKVAEPLRLIAVHRALAGQTRQPLHLGLTEAGMGVRGLVWSAAAMGVLLAEGIGDTVRVSLTPRPGGDRREEVAAARELLQALGLRAFAPSVTACPGCGRTSSAVFQQLAERVERHLAARLPEWRLRFPGVETLRVAVMGCVVNGPGESRAADVGISLPGTGEAPRCPVFADGLEVATLEGSGEELAERFLALLDDYVAVRFGGGRGAGETGGEDG